FSPTLLVARTFRPDVRVNRSRPPFAPATAFATYDRVAIRFTLSADSVLPPADSRGNGSREVGAGACTFAVVTVTVIAADTAGSSALVARMVTVPAVLGAVKSPPGVIDPALAVHVTPPELLVRTADSCIERPAAMLGCAPEIA